MSIPPEPKRPWAILFAIVVSALVGLGYLGLRRTSEEARPAPRAMEPSKTAVKTGSTAPHAPRPAKAETATAAARPAPKGAVVVRGAWGARAGEFGRKAANESNPEAPMAIAASGAEVLVVDQVNQRIQRFRGGAFIDSIPIADTVQDIALGPGGKVVALDRLVDQNVKVFGADGKLMNEAPLGGKGIPEPGQTTGVLAEPDGIWVERGHSSLVRVADLDGNADSARPELPGRPSRDQRHVLSLAIREGTAAEVLITSFGRESLEVEWSVSVNLGHRVLEVLMLDSDARGNVYFAAALADEGPAPDFRLVDLGIAVVRLGPGGVVSGRIDVPGLTSGDETRRPVTLDDEGGILVMRPGPNGLEILRYLIPG
ncbi:MAG: hypothetical protein U1E65_18685 [Myxococcota bacterium]